MVAVGGGAGRHRAAQAAARPASLALGSSSVAQVSSRAAALAPPSAACAAASRAYCRGAWACSRAASLLARPVGGRGAEAAAPLRWLQPASSREQQRWKIWEWARSRGFVAAVCRVERGREKSEGGRGGEGGASSQCCSLCSCRATHSCLCHCASCCHISPHSSWSATYQAGQQLALAGCQGACRHAIRMRQQPTVNAAVRSGQEGGRL